MTRWFTSDWHLSHARILEYESRPYESAEQMNEDIISRVSALVSPSDELWIVGDAALGPIMESLPLLERIPCDLVLVAGNHDKFAPQYFAHGVDFTGFTSDTAASALNAKSAKAMARYRGEYEKLSNVVALHDSWVDLALPGRTVRVCHFPPAPDARERVRSDGTVVPDMFSIFRPPMPEGEDVFLVHGHTHSQWLQNGSCLNVGVDAWAGLPVGEDVIVAMAAAGPAFRPALPWPASRAPWTHDVRAPWSPPQRPPGPVSRFSR